MHRSDGAWPWYAQNQTTMNIVKPFFVRIFRPASRCAVPVLLCLLALQVHAQEKKASVRGLVENEKGEPVANASIQLLNETTTTTLSATSNEQGVFTFQGLESNGPFLFTITHVGYEKKQIRKARFNAGKEVAMLITLKSTASDLSEVVVIGYGSQSRSKTTGAITQVKSNSFKDMPVPRIEQALAGQMAGVQVVQYSGTPGTGVMLRVRGLGSVTAGNQPLYVIDGFPANEGNLSTLNTSDIESVDVLKDAAAAAIYGSRGSNGVVLITTKKGIAAKPRFSFDAYYGSQSVAKKIDMMDAYEYARFVADARNNWWVDQKPTNKATDPNSVRTNVVAQIPDFLQPYLAGQTGLPNTDWQDAIFRNAGMQNYSMSVSGGNENSRYYISGNYFNQDGVVINTGFQRYSARANIESRLSKIITLGFNLAPSYTTQRVVSEGGHSNDGVITTALIAMPNFPIYNADGSYALGNQAREASKYSMAVLENPVAVANLIKDKINNFRALGSAYLDIQLVKGLKLKTYFGADYFSSTEDYFRPSVLGVYRVAPPSQATGKSTTSNTLNWISENTLNYTASFNDRHNLSVLAGYTVQKESKQGNSVTGTNYPNDQIPNISAATAISAGSSSLQEWSLLSYIGRVTYDFDNKYLMSASIRRDGSSRFGANNRWGWFPSASIGWRISKEAFFPAIDFISDVKLRASYGKTGNFQIPNYGSYALLSSNNYILSGAVVNGQAPNSAPNPDLSWEKTGQVNLGADIAFFKGQLTLTADYYSSETNDLLLDVPVPYSSGYTSMLKNVGKVSNKGFELGLTAKARIGQVEWTGTFNISTNKNRVEALGPDQTQIISNRNITKIGYPIGSYFGYNTIGVFKDQKDLDNYPHLSTSKPGSYVYEDVDTNKVINSNDRKIIGSPFPSYTAGFSSSFSYKNFDASFLINTVQGVQITNTLKTTYLVSEEGWANTGKDMYNNRFNSTEQPRGGYGRARVQPTDTYYRSSSLTVEDGSFVRIRNIAIGYTLPMNINKRLGIERLRVYVSAQNPFTFTSYKGYNPESSMNASNALEPGIDAGAYPSAKTFAAGINLNF